MTGVLIKWENLGTSLVILWLRLRAPSGGGPGSIPGRETRSHLLQLRPSAAKFKHTYIHIFFLKWGNLDKGRWLCEDECRD